MRRRRIQVEPVLFRVLAVVALVAGQAEDALLEDRVLAIPERQCEAKRLSVVTDAGEAILVPSIRARASVVVRKKLPGGAVVAVVLAHGPPAAFAQVGT